MVVVNTPATSLNVIFTFVENISFDGNAIRIEYKGKVAGDEIKFTRQVGEFATEEFVAKRVK